MDRSPSLSLLCRFELFSSIMSSFSSCFSCISVLFLAVVLVTTSRHVILQSQLILHTRFTFAICTKRKE
ncbi:hypothetical protein C0J52_00322 [Blattella germanica]|nr:hypothetical protein C0J52_00322 [Blattella germanica]